MVDFRAILTMLVFETVLPIRVRSHDRYDGPSRRILIKGEAIFQKHLEMAGMLGEKPTTINQQIPAHSDNFCRQQKCPGCCTDPIHMERDLGDQHLTTTKGVVVINLESISQTFPIWLPKTTSNNHHLMRFAKGFSVPRAAFLRLSFLSFGGRDLIVR